MGDFPGKTERKTRAGRQLEDGTEISTVLSGIFPFLKTQPPFESRNPTGHIQRGLKPRLAVGWGLWWWQRSRYSSLSLVGGFCLLVYKCKSKAAWKTDNTETAKLN